MEFETKKALLEHLGKNPNDRKYVDRLIANGKVYKEGGMYVLVDRGDLLDEVIRLREENRSLRNFLGQNGVAENTTNAGNNGLDISCDERGAECHEGAEELLLKVSDLESDVEYLNGEYEKMERKLNNYQEAIRNCYKWIRDVKKDRTPWPDFKRDILKLDEDISGEDNQ